MIWALGLLSFSLSIAVVVLFVKLRKHPKRNYEHLEALSELAGGVAHEINNPLSIILGRVQSVRLRAQRGSLDPNYLIETVDKIEKSVNRIAKIVNQLRAISKDPSSESALEIEIQAIITELNDLWGQRLHHHMIDFKIEIENPSQKILVQKYHLLRDLVSEISHHFHEVEAHKLQSIKLICYERGENYIFQFTNPRRTSEVQVKQLSKIRAAG